MLLQFSNWQFLDLALSSQVMIEANDFSLLIFETSMLSLEQNLSN